MQETASKNPLIADYREIHLKQTDPVYVEILGRVFVPLYSTSRSLCLLASEPTLHAYSGLSRKIKGSFRSALLGFCAPDGTEWVDWNDRIKALHRLHPFWIAIEWAVPILGPICFEQKANRRKLYDDFDFIDGLVCLLYDLVMTDEVACWSANGDFGHVLTYNLCHLAQFLTLVAEDPRQAWLWYAMDPTRLDRGIPLLLPNPLLAPPAKKGTTAYTERSLLVLLEGLGLRLFGYLERNMGKGVRIRFGMLDEKVQSAWTTHRAVTTLMTSFQKQLFPGSAETYMKENNMNDYFAQIAGLGGERKAVGKCERCNQLPPDGESMKRCSRCKIAWYCSQNCQSTDWKDHKTRCFDAGKK